MEDIYWLGINMLHEAVNEPLIGQHAVCHTVLNRSESSGKSVKYEVLKPNQFSWHNGDIYPEIKGGADYHALCECMTIAADVIETRKEGFNGWGVNHYYACYIEQPHWAKSMRFVAQLGLHLFYRGNYG